MRNLSKAFVFYAICCSSASAADLPSRAAPPVFVAPPAVFSWTGFYVGANAGYGFGLGRPDGPSDLTVPAAIIGNFPVTSANGGSLLGNSGGRRSGFIGGGQIGYNHQLVASNIVLGLEADLQYSALNGGSQAGGLAGGMGVANAGGGPRVAPDGTGRGVAAPGTGLATTNGNTAFFNGGRRGPGELLGTVRGRVGYAFDTLLVYATGGFAYSSSRAGGVTGGYANGAAVPAAFYTDFGAQAAGAAVSPGSSGGSGGLYGYVVGAGLEYALPQNSPLNVFHSNAVTLKLEGLYFNLGHAGGAGGTQVVGVSNTGAAISGSGGTQNNDFGLIRAGINFKFGANPNPVVARY